MKFVLTLLAAGIFLGSCGTYRPYDTGMYAQQAQMYGWDTDDRTITESLFRDKSATISEDNIKKILEGKYQLPDQMRVAIVKLKSGTEHHHSYYRTDEEYLKTQQSYITHLTAQLKNTGRVSEVMIMPELLISEAPSFTNIRESAVRMQADVVVVFSVRSDVYYKYKFLSKADIKAFATTEVLVMDNRTGLIPFSTVVTRDTLSNRTKEETGNDEMSKKLQNAAAVLTINDIGRQLTAYLKERKY